MKQSPSRVKKRYTLLPPSGELGQLITTCPHCGGEVGMWSEEAETTCIFCDHRIFERETTTH